MVLSEYNNKMQVKASEILHVSDIKRFIAGARTEDKNKEYNLVKLKSLF